MATSKLLLDMWFSFCCCSELSSDILQLWLQVRCWMPAALHEIPTTALIMADRVAFGHCRVTLHKTIFPATFNKRLRNSAKVCGTLQNSTNLCKSLRIKKYWINNSDWCWGKTHWYPFYTTTRLLFYTCQTRGSNYFPWILCLLDGVDGQAERLLANSYSLFGVPFKFH